MDTPYMKPREAAEYLTISMDTFYTACAVGGLRHIRVNGNRNIRVTRQWCDEWMRRNERVVDAKGEHVTVQTVQPYRPRS